MLNAQIEKNATIPTTMQAIVIKLYSDAFTGTGYGSSATSELLFELDSSLVVAGLAYYLLGVVSSTSA